MPTGYTYKVENGEVTELEDFIWICARGMGALVSMRDEPEDAEIPMEFIPGDYHRKHLDIAIQDQIDFEELSETDKKKLCKYEQDEEEEYARNYNKRTVEKNFNHQAMIEKVSSWAPPSPDHEKFKEFMMEQLEKSMSSYVHPIPERLDYPTWLERKRAKLERNIDYHRKEWNEELARVSRRNLWIKQLRESLKDG